MKYENFDMIREAAAAGGPVRLAVAGCDAVTAAVVAEAKRLGIADAVVCSAPGQPEAGETVRVVDTDEACTAAVELVRTGKADVLMKGHVPTPAFFRAVLDVGRGLRSGRILSHCFLFTTPRSPRIRVMTDGALNIAPGVETKAAMIDNAVTLLRALGWERPAVAVLAGTEEVREDIPASVHAAELARMAETGRFPDAAVFGPVALDVAVDIASARSKGLAGLPVAGCADILVTPDILCCNIAAKCIYHFAEARYGGVVVGAAAPVISLSRADTKQAKLDTIALGALYSRVFPAPQP